MTSLSGDKKRAVKRAVDSKASIWLTVIPVSHHHFDLSPTEFRDALALRYQPFLKVPTECDGCSDKFTFQHALDCRKGRLVTQRHNEVRDAFGDLASIAFKDVIREPVVQEADNARGIPALIADLGIRGIWQPQTEALFDIRVVDTVAPSYVKCTVEAVLQTAKQEKKKYLEAVQTRRATFSPFVVSVDGVLSCEAIFLIKSLAEKIAYEKSLSEVTGWVRARMAFAILRATNLCLRGSRKKWRSGTGMNNGARLPFSEK